MLRPEKTVLRLLVGTIVPLGAIVVLALGCDEECVRLGNCAAFSAPTTTGGGGSGGSTTTMTTMSSTGGGGDGGGGGIDPGCIPSMLPAGEAVSADCGVPTRWKKSVVCFTSA